MPSNLRQEATFAPFSAHNTQSSFPHATSPRPQKKQRMTITQTYRLAHFARGKLSSEASRGDHDLRLLVGHANLLDSLMVELQDAENEQEAWFNETMKASPKSPEEPKHVQWVDVMVKEAEADDEEEDSDSEDEYEQMVAPARRNSRRSPSPAPVSSVEYYGDDEEYEEDSDDEFDNLDLALVRTHSHQPHEHHSIVSSDPPELVHDSDDSDDEATSPPSTPPQSSISLDLAEIHRQQGMKPTDFSISHKREDVALLESGAYLLPQEQQAPLIATF